MTRGLLLSPVLFDQSSYISQTRHGKNFKQSTIRWVIQLSRFIPLADDETYQRLSKSVPLLSSPWERLRIRSFENNYLPSGITELLNTKNPRSRNTRKEIPLLFGDSSSRTMCTSVTRIVSFFSRIQTDNLTFVCILCFLCLFSCQVMYVIIQL